MNPADPSHYEPHPLGYACRHCGVPSWIGVALQHASICDVAPRGVVLPSDQTESPNATPAQRKLNVEAQREAKKRSKSLAASAREGTVYLHHSEAEVAAALDRGEISMSDAMNQDF